MQKILVSSCLLGQPVRYNGKAYSIHPILEQWQQEGRVIAICPEVSAGLPTPRTPAEIEDGDALAVLQARKLVKDQRGEDMTQAFITGAYKALTLCQQHHIKLAVLTENSPSCGSSFIYDGSFSRQKIEGMGVTSALLHQHKIKVFSQDTLDKAVDYLHTLSAGNKVTTAQ